MIIRSEYGLVNKMNKLILFTTIIFSALTVNAQTNREVLDKLQEMEFERELRDIERDLRNQNYRSSQATSLPPILPSESVTQKEQNAKHWNLTYSEYEKRDEIGEALCGKRYQSGTTKWANCWRAIILNVSESEAEERNKRGQAKCSKLGSQQQKTCFRDVMVFNK